MSLVPALRPFLPADAPLLAEIFRAAIDDLAADDYDDNQRAAWAVAADDEEAFAARLAGGLTLVATVDAQPVGFAALKGSDHLDLLYVHPAVARQGVASALVDALERLVAARGAEHLTTDASDTARPFFEGRGFVGQSRNTVLVGDEWLANTTMRKALTPAASTKARS
jgi:putative acetyltransferase